jgi:hypothetical protein
MDYELDSALYKIYISTSNFPDAGHNCNVFMQIFGTKKISTKRGSRKSNIISVRFPLEKSLTNSKKFQAGQTDKFEIEETQMDKIKKIRLTLLGNLNTTRWHLKRVIVKLNGIKWMFLHKKWVTYSDLTNRVECDLVPLKDSDNVPMLSDDEKDNERPELQQKIRYDIKIKTNISSNLSDSNKKINLKIVGKNDVETNIIKLNSSLSDEKMEKFQSENIDLFYLEEYDVGTV